MPLSPIPDIKAALLAAFAADTDLAAIQRSWDHPGIDNIEHESVFLGRVTFTREFRTIGRQSTVPTVPVSPTPAQDEDPEIEVVIVVRRDGESQGIEERMWEIASWVERAIRKDVTLGNLVLWTNLTRGEQNNYADGPSGHLAELVLTVACKARI